MSDNKVYKEGYKDGIKFAILAAKAHGVNEEFIKRLEREYSGEEQEYSCRNSRKRNKSRKLQRQN